VPELCHPVWINQVNRTLEDFPQQLIDHGDVSPHPRKIHTVILALPHGTDPHRSDERRPQADLRCSTSAMHPAEIAPSQAEIRPTLIGQIRMSVRGLPIV
jgi:hypothetical protein